MNKIQLSLYSLVLSALLLWQCEPKVDAFKPTKGEADFSTFVAIGDSYTAGYTDGALSRKGQESSYCTILATQLMAVGAGEYTQPFLPEDKSIGSEGNGSYYLVPTGNPMSPVMPMAGAGDLELLTDPGTWVNGLYNNVGVPGAKSFHLLSTEYGNPTLGQGNFNPFFARFVSEPGNASMLSDAMASKPTFFSLWLAGNDVLTYALSGGQGNNGGMAINDITEPTSFAYAVNAILTSMVNNSGESTAKGVIGNIPDVDMIPHISYIKYNMLPLSAEQAEQLNAAYAQYNAAAEAYSLPKMEFHEGYNPFIIADPTFPIAGMRQAKEGEKILLGALSGIQGEHKWGSAEPIPVEYTLDLQAVENIKNAIVAYNAIIADAAQAHDVALADINALVKQLDGGYTVDGNTYTGEFITGGVFSLDGIHATGRGSAIIANAFIKAINAKYGSNVPLANVNDYATVEFP